MLYSITNETLKSRAQKIQQEFENGGASWEGVALEIARLELSLEAIKKEGLGVEIGIDLGTWDVAWVIVAIAKMWEISKLFSGGLSLTLYGVGGGTLLN